MNFHQKHSTVAAGSAPSVRYLPVLPRDHPSSNPPLARIAAFAGAPIFGSSLLFPRRFDETYRRLVDGDETHGVTQEHAVRYYGDALHLDIDTHRLTHRLGDWVKSDRGIHWVGLSFLDSADWRDVINQLDESPVHREMFEITRAGKDFRDTYSYRKFLRAIELGRPSKRNNIRLAGVAEVEAYFSYCRDLIKSMKKRGVVRHRQSWAFHRLRVKHRDARHPLHDSAERDIGVAITAEGEMIRHLGGKHRTAIAQALNLPTLPVEVRMVHTTWLARQIEATGLPAHLALKEGVHRLATSLRAS